MTDLHVKVDFLEGELASPLAGPARNRTKRAFAVLTLMRGDGTHGLGEASPLPGYSPDSIETVVDELRAQVDAPIRLDPLASPRELLDAAHAQRALRCPSSRFALDTAVLDWLGQTRGEPVHRILAGSDVEGSIPIADLVFEADPAAWPAAVDARVEAGCSDVKLKVGHDVERELRALLAIRRAHPELRLRLDGNGRIPPDAMLRHASTLEAIGLELFEEPSAKSEWRALLDLPLPFALDETLRDPDLSTRLLDTGRIAAVVLKPTVLGGLRASLEIADAAAQHGAQAVPSHTFDGPIARAATAELALALGASYAAGLGEHPALALWPPHRIAAIRQRHLAPHDAPGIGLRMLESADE